MKIEFIEPFSRAWNRMLEILFKPFDLALWFALGFSAWMANLFEGYSSPLSYNFSFPKGAHADKFFRDFLHLKEKSFESINFFCKATSEIAKASDSSGREGLFFIITFVVIFFVVLIFFTLAFMIAAAWLKNVFEFIFIDNLLSSQFTLSGSWKRYRALGTSAFIWQIFFYLILSLISLVIWGAAAAICFPWLKACWEARSFLPPDLSISISGGFFLLLSFALTLLAWCVNIVFRQFVIALMYKNEVGAIEGWSVFFNLTRNRRVEIVKFFFAWAGLKIVAWMAVSIIALLTCCILWIVFMFPYLWAVLTLPILVFFRLYSLEFISQFGGPESDFFGRIPEA